MSSKRLSPTASALRSSRFFSLPQPLSRPPEFVPSNTFISNPQSSTATLPHPVQQAIATTPSARARGDWGLKRSLPRRSTQRSSNVPVFRVNAIDTREHITDFESAGDHTVTRDKFLDLGLPLLVRTSVPGRNKQVARSSFEPATDNTDRAISQTKPSTGEQRTRWKFEGPWLAGLSENEFLDYVERELRGRKEEFLAFLREHEAERVRQDRRHAQLAAEGRQPLDASSPAEVMTDEEFTTRLRDLRAQFNSTSPLAEAIARFLDLPGAVFSSSDAGSAHASSAELVSGRYQRQDMLPSAPPRTHPSAGLSYQRSDSILHNHPIFGPLATRPPTVARVIRKPPLVMLREDGFVGVAGLVVRDEMGGSRHQIPEVRHQTAQAEVRNDSMLKQERSGRTIGVAIEGGMRLFAEPVLAHVDETGRVQLQLAEPSSGAVDSRTMNLGGDQMATESVEPSYRQEERRARRTGESLATMKQDDLGRVTGLTSNTGAQRNSGPYGIGTSASQGASRERTQTQEQSDSMSDIFNTLGKYATSGNRGRRGNE